MATNIELPADVIEKIFSKTIQGSAVMSLAQLVQVAANRDTGAFTANLTDASYHDPVTANGPKTASDDKIGSFPIHMATMYKALDFPDYQAEDAEFILSDLEEKLPAILIGSFDKSIVASNNVIASSPFRVTEGMDTVVVDSTPETWEALESAVNDAGYNANGMILDNSLKTVVRAALVAGTHSNILSVNPVDGLTVGNIPAYFRNLGGANAAVKGIVGDWTQAAVGFNKGVTVKYYDDDDYNRGMANMNTLLAKWRVGFGIADKAAFKLITL